LSLKFFTDQCVPATIERGLRNKGYEVLVLKNHIPIDSPDEIVIAKAQELDTILISLNGDFSNIVTYPPDRYKGIISIQLRNHPEVISLLMQRLIDYLANHDHMKHYQGKLFIVEVNRIRIRE
jgi:predicted nuclease of predicted toxin-antitoxin system